MEYLGTAMVAAARRRNHAPRRILQPAQLFVLLDILGGVAALMVAGMIAPAELYDHIGGSATGI